MAGVDSTTWQRGYTYQGNKLNTSSNTGNKIVNEASYTKKNWDNPAGSLPTLRKGGDDGNYDRGAVSAESAYNPLAEAKSAWDSWLDDQIGYYKGLYENALASIDQQFKSARDQANVKRKMGENWIKSNSPYDEGRFYKLGNQNQQNWINATMNARNERNRANTQALADFNNQKANARSVYAQKIASLM